jgi:hypothetical protein
MEFQLTYLPVIINFVTRKKNKIFLKSQLSSLIIFYPKLQKLRSLSEHNPKTGGVCIHAGFFNLKLQDLKTFVARNYQTLQSKSFHKH